MGYGGKSVERQRARELRAEAWTLREIAEELGVSKSSASLWTRDVDFVPRPRNRGHSSHTPHPLHLRKLAEIERCRIEANATIGTVTQRDLLMICLALAEAIRHWELVTGIPSAQFSKPYRAVANPTCRRSKHHTGCATVLYSCTTTHRRVMAMIAAISSRFDIPG